MILQNINNSLETKEKKVKHNIQKFTVIITIMSVLSGCSYVSSFKPYSTDDAPRSDITLQTNSISKASAVVPQGLYTNWHQKALSTDKNIGKNKTVITTSYNELKGYNPTQLGGAWITAMADVIAQNASFATSIRDQAGTDKMQYAKRLLKNPELTASLEGAIPAFQTALQDVNTKDKDYRLLSARYEAFARGKTLPQNIQDNSVRGKYFDVSAYSSKTAGNPSIMERMLTVAAVKILEQDTNPALSADIAMITQNNGMTNCLETARKNSNQCQAASHDEYDLSFCMAKHAIGEVSKCFSWIL